MTCAIRTNSLTKRYRRVSALDSVNLEVQEGAVYALVGQSGAGKTTAIKILMNLIAASSGAAEVLGMDSTKIRGEAYARIGYVSENQEMPEWMRVGAMLTYLADFYPNLGCRSAKRTGQAIRIASRPQDQRPFQGNENETRAGRRSCLSSQQSELPAQGE